MPKVRQRATPVVDSWQPRPSESTRADRAEAAARAIIKDAHRSSAYTTALDEHLRGLGHQQLKVVVRQLFIALANLQTR